MTLILPTPIDLYFESENTEDTEILGQLFAENAVVSDESQIHRGLEAIKAWKREGKLKTGYTINPLSIDREGERTLVSAKVAGRFPGSPITLIYAFTLKRNHIAKLEIG